jgi:redox-sensitive bicupin YhaK (pirin superfamily)
MPYRKIQRIVRGTPVVDGAGVRLVRVLGPLTTEDFDPFLMLDSFDSRNPQDYTAGFPMHPHRGIETVTFLIQGIMDHEDSLGNKGRINAGDLQWMTAGSGIMHQEMPKLAERILGFQLWLNLPRSEKMTNPKYFDISPKDITEVEIPEGKVRVISGEFAGAKGVKPHHIQARFLDFSLNAGKTVEIGVDPAETVFVFLLEGDAMIDGQHISEKSAVLLANGDMVKVEAMPESNLSFQLLSAPPLHEQVTWAGPIVMNTREEVMRAFEDLREGSFIKDKAAGL